MDASAKPANLMDNLEYRVGRFTLLPFRELLEDGVPVSIGRKALDLLSVLAKANGALVTKDELMAAVWPNAIVEENAIQVHIAALRKVLGEDAHLLTTTRGLGYRLASTETGVLSEPSTPRPEFDAPVAARQAEVRRRFAWALPAGLVAGLLAVVLVLGILPSIRKHDEPQIDQSAASTEAPTIAVLGFQPSDSSNDAKLFADGLAASVADALGHYNVTVIAPSSSFHLSPSQRAQAGALLGADFVVDGHIARSADKLTVSSQISDTKKNLLVYSFDVELGSGLSTTVATQIATHLALALDPRKFSTTIGKQFTTEDYVLMARANEAIDKWDMLNVMDLTAQLAARHPDDAELQANAGLPIILALPNLPESQRHQALQTARAYIDRAVQLGPPSGNIYLAQSALIQGPLTLAAQEGMLRKSLEVRPTPQVYDGLGETMAEVGRIDEAVAWYQRSVQRNPLSVIHARGALIGYIFLGRLTEASQLLDQAELLWPGQFAGMKCSIALGQASPEESIEVEKRCPVPWDPAGISKEDGDLARQAMIAKDKEIARPAIDNCFRNYGAGRDHLHDYNCLALMMRAGAIDDAFHFAEIAYPDNRYLYPDGDERWITAPLPGLETKALFVSWMASFRDDPRFWPLAERTGLVDYWQSTQKWPDFCRDKLEACKAHAAEAARNDVVQRAALH